MMGLACISPFMGSSLSVENFRRVNIVPALKGKIWQCLLYIVIVLEHLVNEIDIVGRSICRFHIAHMKPFRNIGGEIVARTHLPN